MSRKRNNHLTYDERCHMQAHLKSGKSNREIAKLLGCSHTTINKEIKRNKGKRGYRQDQAHELQLNRQSKARQVARKVTPEIRSWIVDCLVKYQRSLFK